METIPGNYRILIVDDEDDVREFISYNLTKAGYKVSTASDGNQAVTVARKEQPHLILMDLMMPVMDGIEACSIIRTIEELKHTLICFLTARGEDYSQIAGFESGGDDYIVKPVKPKILLHRISALLRRYNNVTSQSDNGLITSPGGTVTIDRDRFIITRDDELISLPKKEFDLLALLLSIPGRVFTREEIYDKVWGESVVVGERTIDVHIRKLRERLGDGYIDTIKGVGYKFRENM